MAEEYEIRKGNMADVIRAVATILAEHGCDPEQLRQLEPEQLETAKTLLAYIRAWAEITDTNMPTCIRSPWAGAKKTCTMVTKDSYSKGPNMAILAEAKKLWGTPNMIPAEEVKKDH